MNGGAWARRLWQRYTAGQNPQVRPLKERKIWSGIRHAEPNACAKFLSRSTSIENRLLWQKTDRATMCRVVWLSLAILLSAATLAAAPLRAQNSDPKSAEHGKGDAAKDTTGRTDDVSEAVHAMTGPASRGECIWLGERAVGLMWKDDLDTAFRHLELYDRFGCPGEHIQISFRCVVRQGNIDQKDQKGTDAFNARVHSCWINPALPPVPTTPSAPTAEKPGTK